MKIRTFLLVLIALVPSLGLSFGNAMLNLRTPADLGIRQMQLSIVHRFYGKAFENPFDSFFGMTGGSNVGFVLETVPIKSLVLDAGYTFNQKEAFVSLGIFHRFKKPGMTFQLEGQLFSFRPTIDTRETGVFAQGVMRSDPLARFLTPVVNFGYDGYWDEFGLGIGLELSLTKKISLIGEYYPRLDSESAFAKDGLAFGIRLKTYGHQFLFQVGNMSEIGNRHWMRGSGTSELYFGFTIHRWFD